MPNLEITEVILVQRNIVNSDYQQDLRVFSTFVLNKSLGQLLDISPKNFMFLKNFNKELSLNSELRYFQVWFTDHNFKLLETVDQINITLVIN